MFGWFMISNFAPSASSEVVNSFNFHPFDVPLLASSERDSGPLVNRDSATFLQDILSNLVCHELSRFNQKILTLKDDGAVQQE